MAYINVLNSVKAFALMQNMREIAKFNHIAAKDAALQ